MKTIQQLPVGLLGTLVLLLSVESFLASRPLEFGLPDLGEWSYSGSAARGRARESAILCFGDSVAKCGVHPKFLERALDRPAYNLAVSAASASSSYYLLRRALRNGATPTAIVVDFQPTLLTEGPENVALWGQLLEFGELLELAWNCRDAGFFARSVLERYVPSIGGRDTIRLNILAAVIAFPSTRRDVCLARYRNWNQNRGAYAGPVNPSYVGQLAPFDERHLLDRPWNRVNLAYARRFLALADGRRIPVFLVVLPLIPGLEQSREKLGLNARYERLVQGWQRRFTGLSVLDARHSHYQVTEFGDAVHLNRDGAASVSRDIAGSMRQRLDGALDTRWVSLPRYRRLPSDGMVEDFNESLAFVRATELMRK